MRQPEDCGVWCSPACLSRLCVSACYTIRVVGLVVNEYWLAQVPGIGQQSAERQYTVIVFQLDGADVSMSVAVRVVVCDTVTRIGFHEEAVSWDVCRACCRFFIDTG